MTEDPEPEDPDAYDVGPVPVHTRWRWLVFPLAVLAFAAGLTVGPRLQDGDGSPSEDSVEVGFARDMRVHHLQAIGMSSVAMRTASDPAVRGLALDVYTAQTGQAGQMAGWLGDWDRTYAGDAPKMAWMQSGSHGGGHDADSDTAGTHELLPDGRMPGMATTQELTALRTAAGVEVDRTYLRLLITHHRGGLAMAQEAAARSRRPAVRLLATQIYQSQSAELNNLIADLTRLGGSPPPESDVSD